MRWIEHIVKALFNLVGFDIVKSRPVACPRVPKPPQEVVERTTKSFSDAFPISPDSGMSRAEIEKKIQSFLWFYPFEFGGIRVAFDAEKAQARHYRDHSHRQRHAHIFPPLLSMTGGSLAGNTVLDIACNAGFWSIQAKRAGADSVTGVDASPRNVEQAQFIAQIIGLDDVEYRQMNSYDISKETLGEFDITFFFGLLYHLDKPILAFERLYDVTRKLAVIDTRLVKLNLPMLRVEADEARQYHSQSHTNPQAHIPSAGAVPLMLKSVGFREVYRIQNATKQLPTPYLNGMWGSFIAVK